MATGPCWTGSTVNSTQHENLQGSSTRALMIQAVRDWPAPRGPTVRYHSRGSCLVFGPPERVEMALDLMPPELHCITFSSRLPVGGDPERCFVGQVARVRGHLGNFRARVVTPGGEWLDPGSLSPGGDGRFDMVLDLEDQPLLESEVKPYGYRHCPTTDPEVLEPAVRSLPQWLGEVHKPRFFHYHEALCVHDRQGVSGCQRCLEACPAGAIQPGESGIQVDPYLCQGCGTCTLVCPGGALEYAWPEPRVIHQRLQQLLEGYVSMAEGRPSILFYEDTADDPARLEELAGLLPERILPFPLPALAAIGADSWLLALAGGVQQVLLLITPGIPTATLHHLEAQVAATRRLLRTLEMDPDRLQLLHRHELKGLAPNLADTGMEVSGQPDATTLPEGKRARLLSAIGKLATHRQTGATFDDSIELGLGSLSVDGARCTLCQACINLCPVSALSLQDSALHYRPANCLQCGLCVQGCPEGAMRQVASFPLAALDSGSLCLHRSAGQASCILCGTPFADRRMVERSIEILQGLPDFDARQIDLLRMCPRCRQEKSLER